MRSLFKVVPKGHLFYGVLFVIVVALDQASKHLALEMLPKTGHAIDVLPFFNLTLAWNKGVSFSLFSSGGDLGRYLLCAVSLVISVVLFIWYLREKSTVVSWGLIFIIGGAIGNLIDRIFYGAVIDFLHVFYQSFSWPVFNIADTFITIGVGLILIDAFFMGKEHKAHDNEA